MTTELRHHSDLKPNPKNPRFIRDEKFDLLVRSIREFPEMLNTRPVVVNTDLVVLGGNMRLRAAIAAGVEMIPVTVVDWSEEKQRQFIIKDNVSGGEWDWEMLANEWNDAELIDWGVDLPEEEAEPEEDEPLDTEAINAIVTDIALGDVFEIGPHRLVCGDSTVDQYVDTLTDGNEIDAIFMDPPYALFGNSSGMEKVADDKMIRPFFRIALRQAQRITKPFAHIYVCCDWHSAFTIEAMAREVELKANNLCIWDKGDGGLGAMYQQSYEMIWFFDNRPLNKSIKLTSQARGVRTVHGSNIWRHNRETGERAHSAQKPIALITNALKNSSDEGQIVADLFVGGGSTMVAAHQINRRCFAMEIDPKYCHVTIQRMLRLDPTLEVKRNGEKYTTTGN